MKKIMLALLIFISFFVVGCEYVFDPVFVCNTAYSYNAQTHTGFYTYTVKVYVDETTLEDVTPSCTSEDLTDDEWELCQKYCAEELARE